jgi:acetolactate synthase-1/2/3 large subunit
MKYSELIAEWLTREGYTTCFYVAGGGIMHLLDAFRKSFECISVVHEHTAGVAAEHFNECSNDGKKAFALVTTGPGLTNIITAVSGCYVEHRSLLVVAGQVKSSDLRPQGVRQLGVQEIDGQTLLKSICVTTKCLTKPINENSFLEMVRMADGLDPGPVLIEVCLDVQGAEITQAKKQELTKPTSNKLKCQKSFLRAPTEINQVIELISRAKRPLIVFGGLVTRDFVRSHYDTIENLGIPVATTVSATDRIPTSSSVFVGRIGTWGAQRAANLILAQADLIISVGAQLDRQQTGFNYEELCPNAKLIAIFPNEDELNKSGPLKNIKIKEGPDRFLKKFLEACPTLEIQSWRGYIEKVHRLVPSLEPENVTQSQLINPFIFLQNLSKAASPSDILAMCSSGSTFTGALQMYHIKPGQTVTTSPSLASMGYGLATAIGASIAAPDARVIATEGEGGFCQNLQELSLLKEHNLNIKLFIFDNNGYASIRATQRKFFGGSYMGCDSKTGLRFPNWIELFKAYDIPCKVLTKHDETMDSLTEILGERMGPSAYIVKVDPEHPNWPAVATKINDDGSMVSAPLYSMLPTLTDEVQTEVSKYL